MFGAPEGAVPAFSSTVVTPLLTLLFHPLSSLHSPPPELSGRWGGESVFRLGNTEVVPCPRASQTVASHILASCPGHRPTGPVVSLRA